MASLHGWLFRRLQSVFVPDLISRLSGLCLAALPRAQSATGHEAIGWLKVPGNLGDLPSCRYHDHQALSDHLLPGLAGFSGFDAAAQLPAPAEGGSDTHEGQRSWCWFVDGLIHALGEDLMPSGRRMGAIPVEPVLGRTTRVGGAIQVADAPGRHVREAKYRWIVEDFLLYVVV